MATAVPHTGRPARRRTSARLAWLLTRRSALASLRAQLHLATDERIHISVTNSDGDSVVATARALYWCAPGAAWLRLGWEEIVGLEEDPAHRRVIVTSLSHGLTRRAALRVRPGGRLVDFAHERIAASRIIVTRVTIDGRVLWIEGRREPTTGRPHWFVRPMHGRDLDDPELPRIIDRAVAEVRSALGVEG